MARTTRTRSRVYTRSGSYTVRYTDGSQTVVPGVITTNDSIADSHGRPVTASPMSSTQTHGTIIVNGAARSNWSAASPTVTFNNYPLALDTSLDVTPLAAPSGWYLDTIAGTNPSRPVMTPLTLMQDLVDIPGQLRSLGKLLHRPRSLLSAKELASQQLCVQFGWLPLIEDVKQLLDLQSYVIKRVKELKALQSAQGGLRRRIKFGESSEYEVRTYTHALYGPSNYVYFDYDVKVEKKSWSTIRWRPLTTPSHSQSDDELHSLAQRLVLGLTVEGMAKGAWDIIPWTWLIGWFSNIGKYALAYSNTVPAAHSEACFMSSCTRTYRPLPTRFQGVYDNVRSASASGVYERSTKTRIVSGSVTPGFNVPFLDTFRLSVLGALFTQRVMR